MQTETSSVELETALTAILALLVADREERRNGESRRAERILAQAGLSEDQIAGLTGTETAEVHAIVDRDPVAVRPSWSASVIDRARAHLTDASRRAGGSYSDS